MMLKTGEYSQETRKKLLDSLGDLDSNSLISLVEGLKNKNEKAKQAIEKAKMDENEGYIDPQEKNEIKQMASEYAFGKSNPDENMGKIHEYVHFASAAYASIKKDFKRNGDKFYQPLHASKKSESIDIEKYQKDVQRNKPVSLNEMVLNNVQNEPIFADNEVGGGDD